ncbi:MAG: LON peptidase substrate-binding domain-containing protein [Magnetospirillum sp.]|nr:LON peptidase substrate-binding domain-containing protein [Magnetospirillum sp.]
MQQRRTRTTHVPAILPVFAVPGAILLPGAVLPLIAYEPRYLTLVDDVLGAGRLFALVQPHDGAGGVAPGLHEVGTLARITSFGETGDGRYLINATGLTRFRIIGEAEVKGGYRRIHADYASYRGDGEEPATDRSIDRKRLITLVRTHFASLGVAADMAALTALDDNALVSRLAMASPFSPEEKQILLEAPDSAERCRLMVALIARELLSDGGNPTLH